MRRVGTIAKAQEELNIFWPARLPGASDVGGNWVNVEPQECGDILNSFAWVRP